MIKNNFNFNDMKIIYEDLIITPKLFKKKFFSKFKEQILISQLDSDIPSGILLQDSYVALLKTMIFFEETYFYGLIVEGKETNSCTKKDKYFLIDINTNYQEYKDYIEENFIFLENILFSANKSWSLLLTQDFFGVLSGTTEFIEKYKEFYPKWKKDMVEINTVYKKSILLEKDRILPWKK